MKVTSPAPIGHASLQLEAGEKLHVLHPKAILAFQGAPYLREDRFLDLAGMYRKKKWIKSVLEGPSTLLLGLPPGCSLLTVPIPEDSNLLFDYRHILYYTDGITMRSVIQKIKNAWITREFVRMRFSGPGQVGVIMAGEMAVMQLEADRPLYVENGSLIAYPETASIRLAVYGNQLASQHMKVQWEITGSGPVLIQTGSQDTGLEEQLQSGGIVKRLLREVLPFGSVYIK
ncbi:AIM24 family protein [Paenibacillus sp. GCM10023252]|uniref:AIM24 family protein n=1 Tax=Paenibacillus sp. GCM10023252 TaxID=3252649 RepID=UPI0036210541